MGRSFVQRQPPPWRSAGVQIVKQEPVYRGTDNVFATLWQKLRASALEQVLSAVPSRSEAGCRSFWNSHLKHARQKRIYYLRKLRKLARQTFSYEFALARDMRSTFRQLQRFLKSNLRECSAEASAKASPIMEADSMTMQKKGSQNVSTIEATDKPSARKKDESDMRRAKSWIPSVEYVG